MKSFKLLLLILSTPIFLTACSSVAVKNAPDAEIKGGRLEISEAPALAHYDKKVGMLYFSPENRLVLRGADGDEQVLNQVNEGSARSSHATLHNDGKTLYAMWRPKLNKPLEGVGGIGDKLVYIRASKDGGRNFGPIHRLNQQGGAFKPFIASNGKGDVYVAYTDERNSGSDIDIYLNVSHDSGESWKAKDVQIDGNESRMAFNPSVVADGDRVHVSWMTRTYTNEYKIFVRSSEDRGETWLAPVAVHVSLEQPATPLMVKTGYGLQVCWGDVKAVRCSSSADGAKTWAKAVPVEDSVGAAGIFLAADPRGAAHLLIARKPEDEKARVNLFHVVSEDGVAFTRPQRLSGGVPHVASTILPAMEFGDDGSMLVVWVEMRYLRPVIAANYSRDGGKTWLEKDIVLGGKKGLFHFFPAVSYAGAGKYSIVWQESPDRSNPASVIGQTEYQTGLAGVAMPVPDVARLKARVDTFWRLREEGKWDKVYDLLDPYFREANSRSAYAKTQGSVTYHAHRLVGEPEITGSRASVQVAYDSEVPELMLRGKKISVPRTEVEIPQEWIWMDGEWFHVFRDLFGGSTLLD